MLICDIVMLSFGMLPIWEAIMEFMYVINEIWGRYEEKTITAVGVAFTEERAQQEVERRSAAIAKIKQDQLDYHTQIELPVRQTPEFHAYRVDRDIDKLMAFVCEQWGDQFRAFFESREQEVPELTYENVFIHRINTDYYYEYEKVPVID